ncbi:DUF3054 domain-containing protein [Haladaptatus halobius]|uniref:DUF3054 domain-containing protein n=1 Tax=Haladaptatus halobius TaxID=2884875 RepID=UPI001D0AAD53|nr:DUF3054 domain-containing protein [Haladaptatus halobius]
MSSVFGSRRFDRSQATAGLVVGDLLVLATFLAIGELRHDVNPITSPLVFADTIAPFFIGWLVAALALGTYGSRARQSVRDAVLLAGGTWIVAASIGLLLRSTRFFHGDSPLTFAAVVTGFGLLFFVVWRGLAAAVS